MFYHAHINGCNCSDSLGIIYDTYQTEVSNWDVPGTQWYLPQADQVSCQSIPAVMDTANSYLTEWNNRYGVATHTFFPNLTQIANSKFMVDAITQRISTYQAREDYCLTQLPSSHIPPPPPPTTTPTPTPSGDTTGTDTTGTDATGADTGGTDQSGSSSGISPWLLVLGAGAAVLILKKHNNNRRRKK